jgi:hypothetical protein
MRKKLEWLLAGSVLVARAGQRLDEWTVIAKDGQFARIE